MLLYVLIVGLVAALLFLVASAIFGRSEELGPLPEGTTVTVLPASGISACDVRALRFQQVFRGYKAGEVDWALTRLAARIDELEGQLARATAGATGAAQSQPTAEPSPNGGAPIPQVLPGESAPAAPIPAPAPIPAAAPAPAPAPAPAEPPTATAEVTTTPVQRSEEPGAR